MTGDAPLYPLPSRDPISGGELIVTRLECPSSGVVLEGRFSLGWIGKLTPEQLEFTGLLVRHRGNVQKVAADLGMAYNTARSRLDEMVTALEGPTVEPRPAGAREAPPAPPRRESRRREQAAIMERLVAGEIDVETALRELKG